MMVKTHKFDRMLLGHKLFAIRGVREATRLGLNEAKDLVEAADKGGVVLSFTQAYAINAGLQEVEKDKMILLPRLTPVDQPLDFSEKF